MFVWNAFCCKKQNAENELQSMIEQFDVEDKGGVGREEFLNIFLSG